MQNTAGKMQLEDQKHKEKKYYIPLLDKEVTDREGITVTVPKGKVGELRCAFKAGCDCMGVLYTRADSEDIDVIGNCHDGTQSGDKAKHKFTSGSWNLWVYNRTKTQFENMIKKSVVMENGNSSFVLGATHRISATNKTCIVCVIDMMPDSST